MKALENLQAKNEQLKQQLQSVSQAGQNIFNERDFDDDSKVLFTQDSQQRDFDCGFAFDQPWNFITAKFSTEQILKVYRDFDATAIKFTSSGPGV